jgi:hypothetical protein
MKKKQFNILSGLLIATVLRAGSAEAGIGIEYSNNQGWNAKDTGTTNLYAGVAVNAGDVVVMSVADNKKNSIALVKGGWSGGANGVLTDLETSGDTYPASYISYIEIEQAGTYDFWMECGDPNLTAISALYVLRPDNGETVFLADSAEWIDPDNADNGTAYSLDYTFATTLTDGVLIEAISARTDLITEPVTYTEDRNGSDKRLLASYDGVTGGGWASAYTLTGGEAGKQTSSGIGVIFSAGVGGGNNGNGGTTPDDTIHEWTFDTEADGTSFSGLVDSGSIGGATFASDATGTYVTNDTLRVGASGDGTSAFRNAAVSAVTSGVYELTWTVVSGQVTTDGINVGLGLRQSSDNTDLLLVRTHYDTATGFIIQTRMNNANTTLVTLGGTTISNLSYRAVVDLDADTFDLFYDLGAGEQAAVTGMALAAPGLTLDMIRFAASSKDYGVSDEFFLDDIAMTIPGAPVLVAELSNPTNTVVDASGDGLASIGETNSVSVVLKNSGAGIVTNAVASLTPVQNPEYFTVLTNSAAPVDLAADEAVTNRFAVIARSNTVVGVYSFDVIGVADGLPAVTNQIQIEVVDNTSPRLSPQSVNLPVVAGMTARSSVVVTNPGNTPITFTVTNNAAWSRVYAITTEALAPVSTATGITLNDPDPGNPYITAETEGVSGVLPIGFEFSLYGTVFSNFFVTADGCIGLGDSVSLPDDGAGSLPDGNGAALIAPFWGSLSSPAGSVRLRRESTYLAVSWIGVDQVSSFGGNDLEFQALLYRDGQIEFRYREINGGWLDPVTVGIQLNNATYMNIDHKPASGTSLRLTPQENVWVTCDVTQATVQPTDSQIVTFIADASAQEIGETIAFDSLFSWSSGGTGVVSVSATVVDALPVYEAVTSLAFSGPAGQILSVPFVITNAGDAELTFAVKGDSSVSAGVVQTNRDYSWIDISLIGTDIPLTDPDPNPFITAADEGASAQIAIGFAFPFFGGSYTHLAVGANGIIRLDGGNGRVRVQPGLDSTDPSMPEQMIAPYWGDLVIDENATLKYHTNSDRMVITWKNVRQYGLLGGSDLTFQAILFADGGIQFQYKKLQGQPWPQTLVGLRNTAAEIVEADLRQPGDEITETYLYSDVIYTQYVDTVTERVAGFDPAGIQVISASPAVGTVAPGGTAEITVTGNASNLSAGSGSAVTNALFTITHNAAGGSDTLAVTFTATNSQEKIFAAAAIADSDGDGQNDDDERIAGTDPRNRADFFVIEGVSGRELSWTSAADRTYTVWYTLDLMRPFEILESGISGGSFADTENTNAPAVYYKVTVD